MQLSTERFGFTYDGLDVLFGRDRVVELGDVLAEEGLERALIVCGSNVGANEALMDPIEDGLGDRLRVASTGRHRSSGSRWPTPAISRVRGTRTSRPSRRSSWTIT